MQRLTNKERERIVLSKLRRYPQYVRSRAEYRDRMLFGTARHDDSGVRGSGTSNPTEARGLSLANPPARLLTEWDWIEAIDEAREDLRLEDGGSDRGYVYIMERVFLTERKRSENKAAKEDVQKACGICHATFYKRISEIVNCVMYRASKKGLI